MKRGNIITSPDEIEDYFVYYYANISKDLIREVNQGKKERGRMKKNYHKINHSQTERKQQTAIKQQKNIAPGEDTIHPQM